MRNAEGEIVQKEQITFAQDSPLYFNASKFLTLPKGEKALQPLQIGSVNIQRRWKTPTIRGSSRPQIVIEGKNGCGGVHTQAPQGAGETWWTSLFRPTEDRTFIAICNCDNRNLRVELTYPFIEGVLRKNCKRNVVESIPSNGSRLYEISMPREFQSEITNLSYGIRCSADGLNKAMILNAEPKLSQISLDHPASG